MDYAFYDHRTQTVLRMTFTCEPRGWSVIEREKRTFLVPRTPEREPVEVPHNPPASQKPECA
jgi:hypothetical protein